MALLVQNGNLLNGNHHHHHLEAKNFRVYKGEVFLTARALSIMSSFLKVKTVNREMYIHILLRLRDAV
jgi:dTDP-4-dehydrorhamnose 3,5-epimerase-like enzyme